MSEEQVRTELVRRWQRVAPSWWDWAGRLVLVAWGVVYVVKAVWADEAWPRLAPVVALAVVVGVLSSFRKGKPEEVLPAEVEKATAVASTCARCSHVLLVDDTQCQSCGSFRVPRDLWVPLIILMFPVVAAGVIALVLWVLGGM